MEPLTNKSIKEAVKLWCSKQKTKVENKYGHISVWNTSAVTNMSNLFYKCKMFNDDISGWDVSKVGPITDKGIYQIAKGFSNNVAKGAVIAKHGDSPESKSEAPF